MTFESEMARIQKMADEGNTLARDVLEAGRKAQDESPPECIICGAVYGHSIGCGPMARAEVARWRRQERERLEMGTPMQDFAPGDTDTDPQEPTDG
jgi:hypothetical protein